MNICVLHACWNRDGFLFLWSEEEDKLKTYAPNYKVRSSFEDKNHQETSAGELGAEQVNTRLHYEAVVEDSLGVDSANDTSEDGPKLEEISSFAPSHPFAADEALLTSIMESFDFDADFYQEARLFLPSTSTNSPVPSEKLQAILAEIELPKPSKLSAFTTPIVGLDPVAALAFLSSLPSNPPAGVKYSDSLLYFFEATKLLLELLTRGRFIPIVKRDNAEFLSFWQYLPTEDKDKERLDVLEEKAPEGIDACNLTSGQEKPCIDDFLSTGSDALIRIFLKQSSLVPDEDAFDEYFRGKPGTAEFFRSFLDSLNKPDPRLEGKAKDLLQLEEKLRDWSANLVPKRKKESIRTALRLLSPSAEDLNMHGKDAPWVVEILLQAKKEPEKTLPLSQFWLGNRGFLEDIDYTFEELEEGLLRDLGKCSEDFPLIVRALEQAYPTHLELSTNESYKFLKKTAPKLEKQGFGVIFPSWWKQSPNEVGLHLHIDSDKNISQGGHQDFLGLNQLVDFKWEISIGDKRLSIDEFQDMVAEKPPLINIEGRWVELQASKMESTFKFLESQANRKGMRLLDAMRFGLGAMGEENLLSVTGFTADGWISSLFNQDIRKTLSKQPPRAFKGELRPYQQEGLSWLHFLSEVGIGGCLADDMGLGKTVQLLSLLALEKEAAAEKGQKLGSTLLVVPMSILENWLLEAERFTPSLKTLVHHGANRASGLAFKEQVENADLILTTYNLIHRDEELFSAVEWRRIALDEAQNIKNVATKQTQAIRKLVYEQVNINETDRPICSRLALTGTPLENHLEELWSIFDFLNPGFLGSVEEFRQRFSVKIERYRDEEASKRLSSIVNPFILRRLKTDPAIVGDLPEKIEMQIITSLTDEQAALYQSVVDDMIPQLDKATGIHRKGLVLSTITKLKQICNHPALYLKDDSDLENRSGKLTRLEQILEVILAEQDRVLIFTQYAQMGRMLKGYLSKKLDEEVLFLHGGLNKSARDKMVATFQQEEGPRIFILSLKAGGFGLNLTQANQVIHYDQWWNPAVQDQATDRAFRIGQKRNVQVRYFLCKGTLEERIALMLNSKKDLAESIVHSTKNTITEMSPDVLRELLSLSSDGQIFADRMRGNLDG